MQKRNKVSTKALAYCAMLTALSVVFARLIGLMPSESSRFSIEAVPIFLAGMLFGPVLGGCVGFAADFIGCLFSPFGYNPIFCIPPILYGVFAGLMRPLLRKQVSIWRLVVAFLLPVVFGEKVLEIQNKNYLGFLRDIRILFLQLLVKNLAF